MCLIPIDTRYEVEVPKAVNNHYNIGALDYGQSGSCVDPEWLIGKVVAQKGHTARWDAMIGRIGVVSHHLRSFLGAIKLTVLRVFVCGVEYFDV